jgi:ABC-type molybdate transport system substrate-binding protein
VDIRTLKVVIAVLAGWAVLAICKPLQAEPLAVGAPPSLGAAFGEILPMFEQEYGVAVKVEYTPSKTPPVESLRRQ